MLGLLLVGYVYVVMVVRWMLGLWMLGLLFRFVSVDDSIVI